MKSDGKFCVLCGEILPPPKEHGGRRLYCDACRREIKARSKKEQKKSKAEQRTEREANRKSINQLAKEAHDLKLTYGQYVAMRQAKTLKRYCQDHGMPIPEEER